MTPDNLQTSAPSPTDEAPATKPVRRRATRRVAPPKNNGEIPVVELVQEPPAPAQGNPESTRDVSEPSTEAPPAATRARRTGRRATRSTPAAAAVPASPAEPTAPVEEAPVSSTPEVPGETSAPVEAPPAAKSARRRVAPVLDVLSEFGVTSPEPETTSAAKVVPTIEPAIVVPEPEAAPKSRRRATRKVAESAPVPHEVEARPAETDPTPSAPAVASAPQTDPVPTRTSSPEVEPAAPVRSRRRRAVRAEATAAAPTPPVVIPAAVVAPEIVAETEATASADTATAQPEMESAPVVEPVKDAPASDVKAKTPARGRKRASAGTSTTDAAADQTASAPPRLATTALLFQAPDLTAAPRRSRRAQSPAGPPRNNEPEQSEQEAVASSDDSTPVVSPEPLLEVPTRSETPEQAREQRRSRRAERATGAIVEALASTGAEPVAPELTKEERAAVEEVATIESELVAEGIDLPADMFGPEDFRADDSDENEETSDETDDDSDSGSRRRRRRGGRGRKPRTDASDEQAEASPPVEALVDEEPVDETDQSDIDETDRSDDDETDQSDIDETDADGGSSRRRRRRRRSGRVETEGTTRPRSLADEVTALKGSTRLEAKRQRRREGRDAGRRRQIITEAEFLARRESVERSMVVRERDERTQIAVLEDGVLVEHYVSQQSQASMAGNVYLGRVQNVLPSMEAAFIDVGKGRNAVLYAGEVNWDAAGLEGQPRRIEQALKSGDSVLVQVTKDPIGHKGARLTSQVTLAGRYLVLVPGGGMTGISRKLPDTERARLKKILRDVVPEGSGVIVRTAAEGASEDELRADVERLQNQWAAIEKKAKSASAPALLQGEPDLAIRVVRDIFNDDFSSLVVQGDAAWQEISTYVEELAPDLRERVSTWTGTIDLFTVHRVDEQLSKGLDRKVWLPSGGSLVIDRTEAMTVVDVNTGKFTGSGGTLEETVTRNNLEAAEEIVRQLRLRDIGGIIVIDFIDMVLESNRDLVLRRLVECLGRDRTKHQVAEVTSLGLVQMTRKRVGQGLVEAFSETCEHCNGRGFVVHSEPIERHSGGHSAPAAPAAEVEGSRPRSRKKRTKEVAVTLPVPVTPVEPEASSEAREAVKVTLATIAAAAAHAHDHRDDETESVSEPTGSQSAVPGTGESVDEERPIVLDIAMLAAADDDAGLSDGVVTER